MQKSIVIAVILAATANFFWAANAIVGKVVVASLPAFTLSQFRWLLALCLLLPFGLPKIIQQWSWYKQNLKMLLLLAVLSVTLYNTLQYWALEYTEAINVGSLLALMPVSISIVSWLYGGRRLSLGEWLTTLFAMFGALLVVTKGQFGVLGQGSGTVQGVVLMVCAILTWALYSVYLKRVPHEGINAIGMLTFFVIVGTVGIVPFWVSDLVSQEVKLPSVQLWWAIGFVAVFPSIVAFICWNQAIRFADATIAGLMATTAPLFNALLSLIFLNATISWVQWAGIVIVIIGVALTLLLSRRSVRVKQ